MNANRSDHEWAKTVSRIDGRSGTIWLPNSVNSEVADRLYEVLEPSPIGLPFVPTELGVDFVELLDSTFGTKTRPFHPMEMYYFRPLMRELQWGDWQTKVRYGFAGHGINSYAYNYQLVARQLAITVQIGGGGYYSDDERTLTFWREAMIEAQALYETARNITLAPTNDAILVVAVSDLRGVSRARLVTWDHLVSHARDEADLINWEGGNASLKETFAAAAQILERYR